MLLVAETLPPVAKTLPVPEDEAEELAEEAEEEELADEAEEEDA